MKKSTVRAVINMVNAQLNGVYLCKSYKDTHPISIGDVLSTGDGSVTRTVRGIKDTKEGLVIIIDSLGLGNLSLYKWL